MTGLPSAEKIANVCRERGLNGFDLRRLKGVLEERGQDPEFEIRIHDNLRRVACGVDDADAMRWFSELRDAEPTALGPQYTEAARPQRRDRKVAPGDSYKAYGQSAALTFEMDELRTVNVDGAPVKTLAIEAATAVGDKSFGWDNKIIVQLTQNELPLFLGAMLGMRGSWSATGHGPAHDKRIRVERQAAGVFVQVEQGSRKIGVRVEHGAAFHVAALCIKALRSEYPHLSSDAVLSMCKNVCGEVQWKA